MCNQGKKASGLSEINSSDARKSNFRVLTILSNLLVTVDYETMAHNKYNTAVVF
ncbi:hypothetical protein THII_0908 [Thioploca ingrica]|uniref:Uncharacterized protein n=1 Tax=Thioploca ingrica TaxID=40754 RepID=A0A090AJS3_9GAMM|nr:hypothetical protein THII_0908 [Thioploca ingrica]